MRCVVFRKLCGPVKIFYVDRTELDKAVASLCEDEEPHTFEKSQPMSHLKLGVDVRELSLAAFAEYYIQRLTEVDRVTLEHKWKRMDGYLIKVGSTCAGTDAGVKCFEELIN